MSNLCSRHTFGIDQGIHFLLTHVGLGSNQTDCPIDSSLVPMVQGMDLQWLQALPLARGHFHSDMHTNQDPRPKMA